MQTLRVLVLLLLALLLPLRGVVASTMVCADAAPRHAHVGLHGDAAGPAGGAGSHAGGQGDGHAADPASAQAAAHSAAHASALSDGHAAHHADHHATGQNAAADACDDGAAGDTCHLCASGCGVTALLTASPEAPRAPPAAQAPFPGIAVPALDFQRGGQDRPPRRG